MAWEATSSSPRSGGGAPSGQLSTSGQRRPAQSQPGAPSGGAGAEFGPLPRGRRLSMPTHLGCSLVQAICRPCATSHTRSVRSTPPLNSKGRYTLLCPAPPPPAHASPVTARRWPCSSVAGACSCAPSRPQTCTVPDGSAHASAPGASATQCTGPAPPPSVVGLRGRKVRSHHPLLASHSLAVPSQLQLAIAPPHSATPYTSASALWPASSRQEKPPTTHACIRSSSRLAALARQQGLHSASRPACRSLRLTALTTRKVRRLHACMTSPSSSSVRISPRRSGPAGSALVRGMVHIGAQGGAAAGRLAERGGMERRFAPIPDKIR